VKHGLRASDAFLCGLKYEVHGAGEVACLGKVTRCAQQHGRVPVVAARVHATLVLRPIGKVISLLDRQRIHISAKSDRGAIAGAKHANHTGFADVAMNVATKFGKLACDKLGRAMLLRSQARDVRAGLAARRSCRREGN
jgi:hypothetical protein